MSGRRGQGRGGGGEDSDFHNMLDMGEADATDQVIGAIRYGMDSIMKIVNDTLPYCPPEDDALKREIGGRMESSLMKLLESELTYSKTSAIVNQVVSELNLQDSPDMDTKEFLEAVDSIGELSNRRLGEYKQTLTPDVLQSHPTFVKMKNELDILLEGRDPEEDLAGMDTADAETEAEEVDLDDSVLDDDGDSHEVIPDLDPISKTPLKDPVRNRNCLHIYGKSTMLQLIKKNPKTRCPAMGCSNKQFVRASDLVEDPRLTAKVLGLPMPSSSSSSPRPATSKRQSQSPKKGRGRRRR